MKTWKTFLEANKKKSISVYAPSDNIGTCMPNLSTMLLRFNA